MKIAIVGSGNVGKALAEGWVKAGHDICFGSRDPESDKLKGQLKQLGPHACASSPAEAARWAEVVVLATPFHAAQASVQGLGDLHNKVLVDSTNPVGPTGGLAVGYTTSAAEQIAGWAPSAKVVKAFNVTGSGNMLNPRYPQGQAVMLFAGDDAAAKEVVSRLAGDLGFDPVDLGGLSMARYLEPMGMVWITLAYQQGLGRDIAFALLKR
jgi:8-hydroxy-5-deazaflavin:NADPH oxidoreductase